MAESDKVFAGSISSRPSTASQGYFDCITQGCNHGQIEIQPERLKYEGDVA
jgi:hypothetical protein